MGRPFPLKVVVEVLVEVEVSLQGLEELGEPLVHSYLEELEGPLAHSFLEEQEALVEVVVILLEALA